MEEVTREEEGLQPGGAVVESSSSSPPQSLELHRYLVHIEDLRTRVSDAYRNNDGLRQLCLSLEDELAELQDMIDEKEQEEQEHGMRRGAGQEERIST